MLTTLGHVLLGACAVAALAQPVRAATIFANDFSAGTGPQEQLTGNFTAADGYLGHHSPYADNENSSYRISYGLTDLANVTIAFDYWFNTFNAFDSVAVKANDTVLATYAQNGASHASLSLDTLARPAATGVSVISFDFTSDALGTAGGFQIDNLVITGNPVAAPAASVPEPASWALVAGGLGALGAARRRGRTSLLARS